MRPRLRLARAYQVNPDFKKQLAKAFGLGSEAEFDSLVSKLRAGDVVDPEVLRKGTLELIDKLRETQAAPMDTRMKVAHKAPGLYRRPVTKNSAIGPTAISTAADEGSRSELGRCSVEMRVTSSTLMSTVTTNDHV